MRGRVADALDARHLGDVLDEQREIGLLVAVRHIAAIGIDVLAEQGHFADALRGEAGDFGQHVVERARHLAAARVGHDAEGAELRATFHDRHEGRGTLHLGWRHARRTSRFPGRRHRPPPCPLRLAFGNQLRQPVQCLRAEDDIDVRRAGDDGIALLAGDAAADADHQVRVELLQVADPAEVVEHLLLRLLAHRAGVEQDDVGLFRLVGPDDAFGGVEHVGHLVRIVLIHLAPEGADEQFLGHGGYARNRWLPLRQAPGGKVAHYTR